MNYLYEWLYGIKMTTVELDKRSYLEYSTNRHYYDALCFIGEVYKNKYYPSDNKHSNYYIGVKCVQRSLKDVWNIDASQSQIRRLVHPHCKRKMAMKFPHNTMEIFNMVIKMVDDNNLSRKLCMNSKKRYCHRMKANNITCKFFILDNFYTCLSSIKLIQNRYPEVLLKNLNSFSHDCKLSI